jgi:hypothetical protein
MSLHLVICDPTPDPVPEPSVPDMAALLSTAAARYRFDGDAVTALKLEAVLSKLDQGRAVRVVDLEAATDLALAKLIPELTPMDVCEVCGDTTETAPLCARCDIAQDAAYERRQDV